MACRHLEACEGRLASNHTVNRYGLSMLWGEDIEAPSWNGKFDGYGDSNMFSRAHFVLILAMHTGLCGCVDDERTFFEPTKYGTGHTILLGDPWPLEAKPGVVGFGEDLYFRVVCTQNGSEL